MDKVEYWVKNIKSHAQDTVRVALVGNKSDLRSPANAAHCVDSSQAQAVADTYSVPYFEVSAKEDTNVNEAFMTLVNEIVGKSLSHSLTHSLTYSLTYSLTHSLTYFLTHSLTLSRRQ